MFSRFVVVVLRIFVRVVAGLWILTLVVRLGVLVRFLVVRLVIRFALANSGLFVELFPVSGINLVCESLHGFESCRFSLLAHDVFDSFRKTRVIMVLENCIVPIGADKEAVELDVVLDEVLVALHFQVVKSAFSIASWIYTVQGPGHSQLGPGLGSA